MAMDHTVSSDGWSDINTNKIINVVVHTPKPYLYNSIDTKEEVHDGKYIAKILAEEIEAVGKHKVVAVVTDHAANMRKAWEILEKAYPWILFEGCKAHMLNLAAKDICQRTMVALRVKFCQDIVRKSKPQKILSKIQLEKMGSSTLLQLPIETRWGTYAKLINSIIANESCLKEAIWNAGIQDNRVLNGNRTTYAFYSAVTKNLPALKQSAK
uniref:DUF659 domain-containing protein n=1 Tax=Ditylenchus dipsaci TaxID=166011 RepID=A0A915ETY4_9BILA